MENKKIKKYEKITKIVGIIIVLILVFGISYAVFKTVTRSEETNTISAGKLDVQIENEQDEILLENSYPITEEEGLKQAPYTFDIVNKGSINAEYDLYIEIEENTTLPTEVVRYYLTVEEEGVEKIVTEKARLISQEETKEREGKTLYKIDTKYIDITKTNKYKLYLWIDYEATKEQASNKYFEARIVVDSVQIYDKNRLVKQIDVSASGDNSVLAYMYADGTVYLKGKGTIASNLSNTLVYDKDEQMLLNNYKKLLIEAGCNEEEVNAITSIEEFDEYTNNFTEEEWNNFYVVMYKEIFTEMGYDASSITDYESLELWFVDQGYMDENGNPTESGNEFFTKFDDKYNNEYNPEPTPATKIVLEDGIENIPEGLYTGNEAITEVRIPASVVSIDARAFYGCRDLKEVVIPDSVTSIGSNAFYNCTSLTSVNIPNSVTSIGAYAFHSCTSLANITIPESVTSIGNYVFSNCRSLTNITIPNSVTSIGDYGFQNCASLKSANIPNSVTSIGAYAFYNCKNLTSIEIPNSVTSIGSNAFYICTGIKKLTIDGTKNYGDLGMPNVEELVITGTGDMYTSTPWYSSINSIKKITISDTITSIGDYAFSGCSSLTSVAIPKNITSIGSYAFSNCSSLTEIEIPNSVTTIGDSAFYSCTNLTSINIPNSVTSIGNYAFWYCTSLTEVEIPNSVTSIGSSAFRYCTGIKKLTIDGTKNYDDLGMPNVEELVITGTGDMYNYSSNSMPWYTSKSSIKSVTIGNSVTSIENYAFYNCTGLTEIEIPNSVTSIGNNAFYSCTSLKEITIPTSVTSIGNSAFYLVGNINYNGSLTGNFGARARNGYVEGDYVYTDATKTKLAAYFGKESVVIIPTSVTSIGNDAFRECTSLKEITIPTSVTSIGSWAFRFCTSLTSVTIPNSVTRIGSYAFENCTSLTQINVDENNKNYTSIDGVLFNKAQTTLIKYPAGKNDTSYEIPNSVTSIGNYAFYSCTNLTSVAIPNSVTSIGGSVFWECTNIKEITIPNSVTSIGSYAFYGWTSLQIVNIDNTEEYVNANWASSWKTGCSAQINYLRL